MNIDSVDFFYLAMPKILDVGDGSQDALLVRVRSGNEEGWGECEASPLVTMAAWNCPMSHSACKPVAASVIGQALNEVDDIRRIHQTVRAQSFDLLQTDHLLSGIDIALWDLLGKRFETPVYRLLGFEKAFPKLPYASRLFGDSPQETLEKAREVTAQGYHAAKFGWGPYGRGSVESDRDQVHAAREGLGEEAVLLVDAGTVWEDNVAKAVSRIPALMETRTTWLEEPFVSAALGAYHTLSQQCGSIRLAGGEGCHQAHQAMNMMQYAGLGYIQIDTGRIGGITSASAVARHAQQKGVTYVNHTFTTHLALAASIQPYAGYEQDVICEYPVEPSPLARELIFETFQPDANGRVHLPEAPGLGCTPKPEIIRRFAQEVEIRINQQTIFHCSGSLD